MPFVGENTADYLKAFESRNFGVALLESFVLNKHTGLAIWTKIQAKGLVSAWTAGGHIAEEFGAGEEGCHPHHAAG